MRMKQYCSSIEDCRWHPSTRFVQFDWNSFDGAQIDSSNSIREHESMNWKLFTQIREKRRRSETTTSRFVQAWIANEVVSGDSDSEIFVLFPSLQETVIVVDTRLTGAAHVCLFSSWADRSFHWSVQETMRKATGQSMIDETRVGKRSSK